MYTKLENCDINLNVELNTEGYMKIIKKVFTLSLSAILGLSFCVGTVFAGTSYPENSVFKPISLKPATGKLRRSPALDLSNFRMRIDNSFNIEDFVRNSLNSAPPFFEDDFEEARPFNLYLFVRENMDKNRAMI